MSEAPVPNYTSAPHVRILSKAIASSFPVFKKAIDTRYAQFGDPWLERFEREMDVYFGADTDAIDRAGEAYCRFALEAMRLQAKFDVTLNYGDCSYEDAAQDVYHNDEYMVNTYLPALLLSHYLWPHHYRQIHWAHENFFAPLAAMKDVRFCDVGIGTGFYSKELLHAVPQARGWGVDVSTSSIAHARKMLEHWNLMDRYQLCQSMLDQVDENNFNAFMSVELLEHLSDPQGFLHELKSTVAPGALGFITAAIDAPNRDHIYLYRDVKSIADQLDVAGFTVINAVNFAAYEVSSDRETVPQSGCFVVRAEG